MGKLSLNKLDSVPDAYALNSKKSGKFGAIGIRQVLSSEFPELANTLCRLEGTILSSTKDALEALYGEVVMNIIDVATDRPIAKIKVGASKDISGGWDINNASVSKTTNTLTNLKQTAGGFESTPLSVEDVVVKGVNPNPLGPFAAERVHVGLSEPNSVEVLSMVFDSISGVGATPGVTNKYKARILTSGETSYERRVGSKATYISKLSNGEELTVMDNNHNQSAFSSSLAKYRRVESQGCVTSTYIPQNYGAEHFTYSTIAYNSELTPCALVTHTLAPVGSDSNDIPRPALSVNTEVSSNQALFTSMNLGATWFNVT